MKNEQQIFEEWKRANKKGLNEGFLDGDEEKPVTSDDSTGEENLEELSNEDEKNSDLDISEEPEEGAEGEGASDDESASDAEGTEGEGEENSDNLEDFKGEGEEDDGSSKEDESGVTTELKDILTTLTTAIQTLSDKVENLGNNNDEGEGEGESEDAATEDFGDAELGDEDNGAEGEGEGESEEGSEGGEGESEEGSEGEGESEEGSEGEGEAEEEDTSEDDATKSEAYNYWHRKGRYLNAKSDYLIGKLNESRFDLLFDPIMTAINAKIRKRIEEAKKELREAALKK